MSPSDLLRESCMAGDDAGVRSALDAGAHPNLGSPASGPSPIMLAGFHAEGPGALACMRLLIEAGANLLDQNASGDSPMSLCAKSRSHPVAKMKLLAEYGAPIDHESRAFPSRPLHGACLQGLFESAAWLLSQGADPNRPDILGRTPLGMALSPGKTPLIQLLLDSGANPDTPCTGVGLLRIVSNQFEFDLFEIIARAGAACSPGENEIDIWTAATERFGEARAQSARTLWEAGAIDRHARLTDAQSKILRI